METGERKQEDRQTGEVPHICTGMYMQRVSGAQMEESGRGQGERGCVLGVSWPKEESLI